MKFDAENIQKNKIEILFEDEMNYTSFDRNIKIKDVKSLSYENIETDVNGYYGAKISFEINKPE